MGAGTGLTRRLVGLRAGGAALAGFGARAALAQTQTSQLQAEYRDTPNGLQMCGTCTLFVRPHGCRVVEGAVERTGWCRLFDAVD